MKVAFAQGRVGAKGWDVGTKERGCWGRGRDVGLAGGMPGRRD